MVRGSSYIKFEMNIISQYFESSHNMFFPSPLVKLINEETTMRSRTRGLRSTTIPRTSTTTRTRWETHSSRKRLQGSNWLNHFFKLVFFIEPIITFFAFSTSPSTYWLSTYGFLEVNGSSRPSIREGELDKRAFCEFCPRCSSTSTTRRASTPRPTRR